MPHTALKWIGRPKRPRAERAKEIPQHVWNSFREILHELYFEQKLPIDTIAVYMVKHHSFQATSRQYRRQLCEKWEWQRPTKRIRDAVTDAMAGAAGLDQQAPRIATISRPSLIETKPAATVWTSLTNGQAAGREPSLHEQNPQDLRTDQLRDDSLDPDASEVCSLITASSSLYSRSFSRSSPATPVSFEISPHPFHRPQLHLKTPSGTAFQPDTPELHELKEAQVEDLSGIPAPFTSSPETPYWSERSRKLLHRKTSINGSLWTIPSTQWSPDIVEKFIPPHRDRIIQINHGPQSFLSDESEGEEEDNVRLSVADASLDFDAPMGESPSHSTDVEAEEVSEPSLFPHRHDTEQHPLKSFCCWPQVAMSCVAQCAGKSVTHLDPISFLSESRTLTRISLLSTVPKVNAIADDIQSIVFKIDSNLVNSTDIAKLIQIADSLSAARLFDDSFVWSQVAWRLLYQHADSALAATPVYATRVPAWISIFTNMANSCTRPEHLQLMALAIQDLPTLRTFSIDMLHSSVSLLYALLGDALRRLSHLDIAIDAAVGCWTLVQSKLNYAPSSVTGRVLKSAVAAATACRNLSIQTANQLESIGASANVSLENEAVSSSLELCVRNILSWCRTILEQNGFVRMVEGIEECFWTWSSSVLDVARFERLAVFMYLSQSMWSQERLDSDTSWIMHMNVVNALRTMAIYTGLTHEAALAAILGIAMPILEPSTKPERVTMASRFVHRIEKLHTEAAMTAFAFDKIGPAMRIHNLINRYTWAGNSKSSLEEFDDPQYARRVGIFIRDFAGRGVEISSSRALQPILGDLREGGLFAQETLLPSTRSSQMSADARSMLSLNRRIAKNGKVLRASNSSWRYKSCDCDLYATGLFSLRRTSKPCSCARYGSNTSLLVDRLSDVFHTRMSLDHTSSTHVSTTSSQMI